MKAICEKVTYTHCCGHNISLIVTTCKLPIVRNVLDKVNEVSQLFVKSLKKDTFPYLVQQNAIYLRFI